jgi:hypothetical protein
MSYVINGTTVVASEQPVSVYVQFTFSDNSSETLTIVVDSLGSCFIGISSILHGTLSAHLSPRAGVATAETEELHCSWVYIVSLI